MMRDAGPRTSTPPTSRPIDEVVGEHEVAVPGEPEYGMFARLGAETFGVFVLVLAGVGVALYAGIGGVGAGPLGTALAFGLAWTAGITVAGHISGGHFNPAVTLGAAVAGRLPWVSVLPYWLAQVVGGALATALLFIVTANFPALEGEEEILFSQASNGFREHSPIAAQAGGVGFGALGAFVVEVAFTAVLVTVFLGARSRRARKALAPMTLGLTLTALVLAALPVTNAALNPARATATAVFAESWALEQLWMFWAAPLVGAAVAGAVAFVLFEPRVTVLELDGEPADTASDGMRDTDPLTSTHTEATMSETPSTPTDRPQEAGDAETGGDLEYDLVHEHDSVIRGSDAGGTPERGR